MIRLGKHLSRQSRQHLVMLVVTSLLRDKGVRKLSRKLNVAEDTIYAIKRGLLYGTAGYARQVYKGDKLANYIFKDLRGIKGKAKRNLQEAYYLVGGSPIDENIVDLKTMNTLSIKAFEDRKLSRSESNTDKSLLRKLNKINNKGKDKPTPPVAEENPPPVKIENTNVSDVIEEEKSEKKDTVQLNELTFSVNGARVMVKSSGGTIIIDF